MKFSLGKISLVFMAAAIFLACGGGGGGGGTPTPTPTASPTPTPAPATHVTINSIDSDVCGAAVAYVTVTDEYNALVTGLTEDDFTLLVDGSPTAIADFSFIDFASTPVSVSFVMDYSRSSADTLAAMKEAAIVFIQGMDDDDEGEVIRFAGNFEVTQTYTTNKNLLIAAINEDFADQANTDVWSPLITAVNDTAARAGRGAVIVFTDGFHNYTTFPTPTVDDVIDLAVAENIPVFAIGYLIQRDSDREDLQLLAEETGGVFLEAPSTDSFEDLYQQIANIIQNQYQVTFDGTGGTELEITVDTGDTTGSDVEGYTCVDVE
ncbi:MAG: VWA domain-containing protein [Desulfobacterales bacterium]|nr:VWA domain-containing protein [Desulfobacterales bacterium]